MSPLHYFYIHPFRTKFETDVIVRIEHCLTVQHSEQCSAWQCCLKIARAPMTVCFTERVGETPPLPRHSPKQACSNGIVGQVSDVGQRRSCMGAHARVRRSPNLTTQRVAHDLNLCARCCALRVYIYTHDALGSPCWFGALPCWLTFPSFCFAFSLCESFVHARVCACTNN